MIQLVVTTIAVTTCTHHLETPSDYEFSYLLTYFLLT